MCDPRENGLLKSASKHYRVDAHNRSVDAILSAEGNSCHDIAGSGQPGAAERVCPARTSAVAHREVSAPGSLPASSFLERQK